MAGEHEPDPSVFRTGLKLRPELVRRAKTKEWNHSSQQKIGTHGSVCVWRQVYAANCLHVQVNELAVGKTLRGIWWGRELPTWRNESPLLERVQQKSVWEV